MVAGKGIKKHHENKQQDSEKNRQKLSEYGDKMIDGFVYGVGYNVAQQAVPAVQKSITKSAKRYAEDHDLDMGYLAEFIEDHKYD